MKLIIECIGIGMGFVFMVLLLVISIMATLQPGHKVVLYFNQSGEMWFDVAVFAFGVFCMAYFIVTRLRRTEFVIVDKMLRYCKYRIYDVIEIVLRLKGHMRGRTKIGIEHS